MARTVEHALRDRLLDAVVADLLDRGLAGASLGRLGAAASTSARMLVHHFGSRQALLQLALARARERQLELARRELPADERFVTRLRQAWTWFGGAEARGYFALFGEVAATGRLNGSPSGLGDGLITDWIDLFGAGFEASGMSRRQARVAATELSAVVRGLIIDLEATGDERRIAAAYRGYVDRLCGE